MDPKTRAERLREDLSRHEQERDGPAAAAPPPDFPRYEIRDRLGEGASAVVYGAWDRELKRPVALKVLRETLALSGQAQERFRREGQAAAGLAHPNVVAVYDVGERGGTFYLVLERVDGLPLNRLWKERRGEPAEAARLVERAARGVSAAHERGIVHRDLKPANILVTPQGEPKVGDFGLAHVADSSVELTRAGTTLGTPPYMAPEQVEGSLGPVSPRTDVYALGAILYEGLTGRPPHVGETVTEIYAKIVRDEPVPPRRLHSNVPRDLETIVLKALEKEPARRYASAAELAEDLRRSREGLPIAARPPSRAARLARRLKRNPAAIALGAAAALAIGVGIAANATARRDREAALGTVREMARVALEAALLSRRVGANERMRDFMPRLESAHREAVARAPELAEPDYLIGRMHRALMEDDKALDFQERALRKDREYAPALYERAILLTKRYGAELERWWLSSYYSLKDGPVTARAAREAPVARWDEAERANATLIRLKDRIKEDYGTLERLIREGRASPAIGEAHVLVVRGSLGYWLNSPGALDALREAIRKDPRMEEAWEAAAWVTWFQRNQEDNEAIWAEAERLFTEAILQDKGYLPHWVGRSRARYIRGQRRVLKGEEPLADFSAAEDDLTQAIGLGQGLGGTRHKRGIIRAGRGLWRMNRGEEPLDDFARAEEDFTGEGDVPEARRERGLVRARRAVWQAGRGGDPAPDFALAEEDLEAALRANPQDLAARNARGYLRIHLAKSGEDLARAEEDFDEALRSYRLYMNAWRNRGRVATLRGVLKMKAGEDPRPDFARAEEDLTQALRLMPRAATAWLLWETDYTPAWTARAAVRLQRALYRSRRGENPADDLAAAEKDLEAALAVNPKDPDARAERDRLRSLR